MPSPHRRTATRVVGGRVLKKNNWTPDHGDYWARRQDEIRIDRRGPGDGYRHLLTVAHVREFLALLPEWDEVAVGLEAVVIDGGWSNTMGWCDIGVVAVCAWEAELWWDDGAPAFEEEHRLILDRLGVERERRGEDVQIRWTAEQARAFQLLHILPHELGHHRDRMSTRRQVNIGRGEPYAESYALRVMDEVSTRTSTASGSSGARGSRPSSRCG